MKKIALIGASGFVGSHYYERAARLGLDCVPIIRSSGNAWRLTRIGAPIKTANLLAKEEIAQAIEGCTHVVNCSRGGDDVMLQGLANLLEVCAGNKIQGFVHLSSVMVYGDPPSADSVTEAGTPQPQLSEYGAVKFKQDQMVMEAAKAGLPSAILCPPNITGAYSAYLANLVDAIQSGEFALMDEGDAPCVVVDVDNLCHAIDQALEHCSTAPQRLFITDDEPVTWKMLVEPLLDLAGVAEPRRISSAELRSLRDAANRPRPTSLLRSLKHLVSSDIREALRKDPLLAKFDLFVRRAVAKLGPAMEDRLRLSIEGTPPVPRLPQGTPLKVALTAQQLRGVRHSCAAAKQAIGYQPPHSFEQSMAAFRRWYHAHTGRDSGYWPLLRMLRDA